jgi:uncharacterized protein involved in exopolysaccharide biosynthesis
MQGGSVPMATPKPISLEPGGRSLPPVPEDDDIDLVRVALLLWARRWWLALAVLLCTGAAAYLAFTTPKTWRADVVVTEVKEQSMGGGGAAGQLATQLSGLAALATLGLGSDRTERDYEAVLESRHLVEEFIVRNKLLPRLSGDPNKPISLWRAVRNFQKDFLIIREDPRRGITTLSVEYTNPATAAEWANGLVALANDMIRTRAMTEAQRNIGYLTTQAEHTTDVDLRRVIFNLLENETKTEMMAKGRPDYAFRTVDPAVAPEIRSGPHRTLLLITGFAVGLLLGGVGILSWDWVRRQRVRLRRLPS